MRYWLLAIQNRTVRVGLARSGPTRGQVRREGAGEQWDGVRNYQARNFMREMTLSDQSFFYHSQGEKAIVGLVEVCAEAHPDSSADDPR